MDAIRGLMGMAAIGFCAGLSGTALATDSATFMKGGEFCFDMTPRAADGFVHLMLSVEPAGERIAKVHAIQRGNVGVPEYANQLSGTATIAPSNDADSDAPTLYVSLTGNGVAPGKDSGTELWTFSYSLALDPATLTGKIHGAEFQSDPVSADRPFTIKAAYSVLIDAKPMPCADY